MAGDFAILDSMTIFLIALGAIVATIIGGLISFVLKDRLHLVLGFGAGAIISVAFFDLLPEALEFAEGIHEPHTVTMFVALGFLIYLVLERTIFSHSHTHVHSHDMNGQEENAEDLNKGIMGASALSIHSFLDGMAVGLAFQVSASLGVVVAVAILLHSFSDGINTVGIIMKNKGDRKTAVKWLAIDALAPALGILSTMFFTLPTDYVSLVLALFTGFFVYLGATDLIPESYHAHPKILTTIMTLVGAGALYFAIELAHV